MGGSRRKMENVLYLSEDGSDVLQRDALRMVKESGLPVTIRKSRMKTSGGRRKTTTVTLKPANVTERIYDDFLDLRGDAGGRMIRTPRSRIVRVGPEGKPEYATFRIVHSLEPA